MPFQIGDRIAHPLHGAGIIQSVETRRVSGRYTQFYILKIIGSGMIVLVPVDSCGKIGVRAISSPEEIEALFRAVPDIRVDMLDNWNKRYRENMQRIKSGDILEVAGVIKGLIQRDSDRGLSTGERRMLNSAKQILLSEIALSLGVSYDDAEQRLLSCM